MENVGGGHKRFTPRLPIALPNSLVSDKLLPTPNINRKGNKTINYTTNIGIYLSQFAGNDAALALWIFFHQNRALYSEIKQISPEQQVSLKDFRWSGRRRKMCGAENGFPINNIELEEAMALACYVPTCSIRKKWTLIKSNKIARSSSVFTSIIAPAVLLWLS